MSAASRDSGSLSEGAASPSTRSDFIRDIVDADLRSGKFQSVVTRFPPEPNGFLHIGHAKSICLNFGVAQEFKGRCHLRMDDTDPTKEDVSFVESIQQDVRWLGFEWEPHLYYASDYFEKFHAFALKLIQDGKAYVDSLNEQEIREYRGTVTEAGKPSPYRERSIDDNLELFRQMRAGEFADGAHVLRAKIDMANPNMKMRDPLLYRIRHAHHYRTGDAWCIYPMYDFAHPISDAIEGVTHSICTLEFENNRELYDWVLNACGFAEPRTHQYEFARLNLNYSVMSKRKFLELVEKKFVSGWDDPRMPTISGLRRRGYTPESIRRFCEAIGVSKANSKVDLAQLEHAIRDDLNQKAPRVLAVLRPLKVVLTNYPENSVETLDAALYPHDVPLEGSRTLPFGRELYIEQDDFMENPPKGYFRLTPGGEVRLRHAYIIRCEEVVKNADGQVVELRCSYDPQTRSGDPQAIDRKVKGTIHWVPVHAAKPVTVHLYDRLYNHESPEGIDDLNPNSLETLADAWVEPWVLAPDAPERFQFERQGYFYRDSVDSTEERAVFNRIVSLKDSWAKATQMSISPEMKVQADKPVVKTEHKAATAVGTAPVVSLTPEQIAQVEAFQRQYAFTGDEARLVALEPVMLSFFDAAYQIHGNAAGLINWLINELPREFRDNGLRGLSFTPQALAELVRLQDEETISGKTGKDLFARLLKEGGSPAEQVERLGLQQISSLAELEPIVDAVIAANPDNVDKYRDGRSSLFGFFVGQVLKQTDGRANPRLVNELLQARLSQ